MTEQHGPGARQAAPLQREKGPACCARLISHDSALSTQHSPNFVVVGHLTCDRLAAGTMLGGAAAYAALTAARLGRKVGIVTAAGPDVDLRPLADIAIACRPSPLTTTFANLYEGGRQRQRLEAVAAPIQIEDVPPAWLDAELAMLAPVAGEVPPELAERFRSRLVLVAPQGWLRSRDAEGRVQPTAWDHPGSILPHVDAVVLSEDDLLGGPKAIDGLAQAWGPEAPILVQTRGPAGARIFVRDRWHELPAYPARAIDPTGAGDVFAAAFLVRLAETGDPFAAGSFAAAAASLAVDAVGPTGIPDRAAIEHRLTGGT